MKIGYARTSTVEQEAGLADQRRELEKAGAERVYGEHVSAVAKSLPQFDVVMAMLRDGDVLIVTKLDRVALYGRLDADHRAGEGRWRFTTSARLESRYRHCDRQAHVERARFRCGV